MDLLKVDGASCPPFLLLKSQQTAITTVIASLLNSLMLYYGPVAFFSFGKSIFIDLFPEKRLLLP